MSKLDDPMETFKAEARKALRLHTKPVWEASYDKTVATLVSAAQTLADAKAEAALEEAREAMWAKIEEHRQYSERDRFNAHLAEIYIIQGELKSPQGRADIDQFLTVREDWYMEKSQKLDAEIAALSQPTARDGEGKE